MAGEAGGADLRSAGEREQRGGGRGAEGRRPPSRTRQEPGSARRPWTATRQTLHAVALDENVREEFEHHRLITEHEPAGLGGLGPDPSAGRRARVGQGVLGQRRSEARPNGAATS